MATQTERGLEILGKLADAFGGYSQVPDYVLGMAIIGQVNNNGLSFGKKDLDAVVGQIEERWQDQGPDTGQIRNEIIRGMKEQAKDWPRKGNEHVWSVIDTLEAGGPSVEAGNPKDGTAARVRARGEY